MHIPYVASDNYADSDYKHGDSKNDSVSLFGYFCHGYVYYKLIKLNVLASIVYLPINLNVNAVTTL